jgi:hypothetical protein
LLALKTYRLSFGSGFTVSWVLGMKKRTKHFDLQPKIYFDAKIDTVLLNLGQFSTLPNDPLAKASRKFYADFKKYVLDGEQDKIERIAVFGNVGVKLGRNYFQPF